MPHLPKWLLGLVASIAVVGSGVAAAAIADDSPTTAAEEPSELVTTTTAAEDPLDAADDPLEASDPSSEGTEGGTERYWGPECGDAPTNHGGYVKQAENNGTARSEAAHSPCGRPLTSVTTTTTQPTTSNPLEDPVVTDSSDSGSPTQGQSHRGGHGGGPNK